MIKIIILSVTVTFMGVTVTPNSVTVTTVTVTSKYGQNGGTPQSQEYLRQSSLNLLN